MAPVRQVRVVFQCNVCEKKLSEDEIHTDSYGNILCHDDRFYRRRL